MLKYKIPQIVTLTRYYGREKYSFLKPDKDPWTTFPHNYRVSLHLYYLSTAL